MQFLDRLGWPVERVEGRPALNFFRLLIHTRKIVRKWEPPKPRLDPGSQVDKAMNKLAWALKYLKEERQKSEPMWSMWAEAHGVESADAAFAMGERVQERMAESREDSNG